MPDTTGRPGRHLAAETEREVVGRYGDRCVVPGCDHRIWLNRAHIKPHPPGSTWQGIGAGMNCFPVAMASAIFGGHIRVGLEDNLYLSKGVLAKGSYEQIAKAVQIAKDLGFENAAPDDAREILGLKGSDKVNF